jgi:hypothetical protein
MVAYSHNIIVAYMRDGELRTVVVEEGDLRLIEDLDEVDILYVMKLNVEYVSLLQSSMKPASVGASAGASAGAAAA